MEEHGLTKACHCISIMIRISIEVEGSLCRCRAALLEVKGRPLIQPARTQDQGTRQPGNVVSVCRYLGSEGHSVLVGHQGL